MTLFEAYKKSLEKLENPAVDEMAVRILLCEINSLKSMSDFYLRKDEEIWDLPRFRKYFDELLAGKPVQYILHKTSFFGENLYVDNRVLIPRQESEEVVDFAIKKAHEIFSNKTLDICDVCCGSGAMGIALSSHLNTNKIIFSDISKDAINVCKKNVKIEATFYCGDSLDELVKNGDKVDLLISNPPYILKSEQVDKSVLDYEPHLALFADDSFSIYEKIISQLKFIRKEKLLAIFEIGVNTKPVLEKIVRNYYPNSKYEFLKDMNGKERIFYLCL